jgi:hypothetical protein
LRCNGLADSGVEESADGLTARERVYGKGQSELRNDHVGSTYKYDVYAEEKPYEANGLR